MSEQPTGLSRRSFLGAAGLTGVGLASGCSAIPAPPFVVPRGAEKKVRTICGACSAGCAIEVRTNGGDPFQIRGMKGHGPGGGGACARGVAEIQNLFHPERLLVPQVRTGPQMAASSWDDALAAAAKGLGAGPLVVAVGQVHLFERLAAAVFARTLGATLVDVGLPWSRWPQSTIAAMLGGPSRQFDVAHADFVVLLEADLLQASPTPVEMQRAWAEGRKRRARWVSVGPYAHVTAAHCDRHVMVPPAIGAHVVAMALLRAVVADDEEAQQRVGPGVVTAVTQPQFEIEAAAASIGIPVLVLERLAEDLLDASAPLVVASAGTPELAQMAVLLDVALGRVDVPGGLIEAPGPVLPAELDVDLAGIAKFPSVRRPSVLLVGANPSFLALPDTGWPALGEETAFVTCISPMLDESGRSASVALPTTTPLETTRVAWGSLLDGAPFAAVGPRAIEPLADVRPTADVLARLAELAGKPLPFAGHDALVSLATAAFGLDAPGRSAQLLKPLKPVPIVPPEPVDEAEIAVEPDAQPTATPEPSPERPPLRAPAVPEEVSDGLVLQVFVPSAFQGGEGAHLPYLHGLSTAAGREAWRTTVSIHEDTAQRLGIRDSDPVVVESARGRIEGVAHLTRLVHPDAVAIPIGLGRRALGFFAHGHGASPLELKAGTEPTRINLRRR